jgi:hypothetical protein
MINDNVTILLSKFGERKCKVCELTRKQRKEVLPGSTFGAIPVGLVHQVLGRRAGQKPGSSISMALSEHGHAHGFFLRSEKMQSMGICKEGCQLVPKNPQCILHVSTLKQLKVLLLADAEHHVGWNAAGHEGQAPAGP